MQTYRGQIQTPADAAILFEACRQGVLPRIQRRLSDRERASIQSGSIFVWDEREADMRRWTDGKSWSASRVAGPFLMYREMEGRKLTSTKRKTSSPGGDDSSDSGEGTKNYRYKADGLVKQSFSVTTTDGQRLHLVSYMVRSQEQVDTLPIPTQDHTLSHIKIPKGLYPEAPGSADISSSGRPLQRIARAAQSPAGQIGGQPLHFRISSASNSPPLQALQPASRPLAMKTSSSQQTGAAVRHADISPRARFAAHPYDREHFSVSHSTPRSPAGSQAIPSLGTQLNYDPFQRAQPCLGQLGPDDFRGRQRSCDLRDLPRSHPGVYTASAIPPLDVFEAPPLHERGNPFPTGQSSLVASTESSRASSVQRRRRSSNGSNVELPPCPVVKDAVPEPHGRWSEERRALDALRRTLRL